MIERSSELSGRIEIEVKGEAEIARLQPDDILLLKFKGVLSSATHERIREHMRKSGVPETVKLLILDESASVSILRLPEAA